MEDIMERQNQQATQGNDAVRSITGGKEERPGA